MNGNQIALQRGDIGWVSVLRRNNVVVGDESYIGG